MRKQAKILFCCLAVFLLIGLPVAVLAQETRAEVSARAFASPETFGYRANDTEGSRPLLTVLLEFSNVRFDAGHDRDFYRRLLFGTARGRLEGSSAGRGSLFDEASYGRFWFEEAAILGPFRYPDDPGTPGDERMLECANGSVGAPVSRTVRSSEHQDECGFWRWEDGRWKNRSLLKMLATAVKVAARNGFDFRRYDRNGDGRIRNRELTILLILATPQGNDATFRGYFPGGVDGFGGADYSVARLEGYIYPVGSSERFRETALLTSWWENGRGDHLTTTDPLLAVQEDAPTYKFVRQEGRILAPELGPQPGTVPLYTWYSPNRGDYLTTSDPAWAGRPGDRKAPDYRFVRLEGYIFTAGSRPSGAVPLYRYTSSLGRTGTGGASRVTEPRCIAVRGGVDVCAFGSIVAEAVGAATLSHELAHTLGGVKDAYGSQCHSMNFTLMSCTIFWWAKDDRTIFELDPFNRMRLGWLQPELLHTDQSACFDLRLSEQYPDAYLIYDTSRGTDEFFLLENRKAYTLNYDGDPWYTGRFGLPDNGLAIWHVKIGDDKNIINVAAIGGGGGRDGTLFIEPPRGSKGQPAGGDGLWRAADDPARPKWLDGTASGLVVRVENDNVDRRGTVRVRVGDEPCPVEPVTRVAQEVPVYEPPPDEGPACDKNSALNELICEWKVPGAVVERRVPWPMSPEDEGEVSWSVTPNTDLKGSVQITDKLPADFQADNNGSVFFPANQLQPGQKSTQTYKLRPGGGQGRVLMDSYVKLGDIKGESKKAAEEGDVELKSALLIWDRKLARAEDETEFAPLEPRPLPPPVEQALREAKPPTEPQPGSKILATPVAFENGTLTGYVLGPDDKPVANTTVKVEGGVPATLTGVVEAPPEQAKREEPEEPEEEPEVAQRRPQQPDEEEEEGPEGTPAYPQQPDQPVTVRTDNQGRFVLKVPTGQRQVKLALPAVQQEDEVEENIPVEKNLPPDQYKQQPPDYVQPGDNVNLQGNYKEGQFEQDQNQGNLPVATAVGPQGQSVSTFRVPQQVQPGQVQFTLRDNQGKQRQFQRDSYKVVRAWIDRRRLLGGEPAQFGYQVQFGRHKSGGQVCVQVSVGGPVNLVEPPPPRVPIKPNGQATFQGQIRAQQVAPGSKIPFSITPSIQDCSPQQRAGEAARDIQTPDDYKEETGVRTPSDYKEAPAPPQQPREQPMRRGPQPGPTPAPADQPGGLAPEAVEAVTPSDYKELQRLPGELDYKEVNWVERSLKEYGGTATYLYRETSTAGLLLPAVQKVRGLLLMRDPSHLKELGRGYYDDGRGNLLYFGQMGDRQAASMPYSLTLFQGGGQQLAVDMDRDGVADLAVSKSPLDKFGFLARPGMEHILECMARAKQSGEGPMSAMPGCLGMESDDGGGGGGGAGGARDPGSLLDEALTPDCGDERGRPGTTPRWTEPGGSPYERTKEKMRRYTRDDWLKRVRRDALEFQRQAQLAGDEALARGDDLLAEAYYNAADASEEVAKKANETLKTPYGSEQRAEAAGELEEAIEKTKDAADWMNTVEESRKEEGDEGTESAGGRGQPGPGPGGMPPSGGNDPRCQPPSVWNRLHSERCVSNTMDCIKRMTDPIYGATGGRCETTTGGADQPTISCDKNESMSDCLAGGGDAAECARQSQSEADCRAAGVSPERCQGRGPIDDPNAPRGERGSAGVAFVDVDPIGGIIAAMCDGAGGLCAEDFRTGGSFERR